MSGPDRQAAFPTTRWTMIHVVQQGDERMAALALQDICRSYWYPVYAYLRRSGNSHEDAEDLTQMTFQKLLVDSALQHARQERGRLRSFLIGLIRQVISRRDRHHAAERRGGGVEIIAFTDADADERYSREPVEIKDPQRLYDHAWAMQILHTVREKLRHSFIRNGRSETWELLQPHLGWEDDPAPFSQLGAVLGSSETAVRVLVHRLRRKFRELLQDEIRTIVADGDDVAAELEWIRSVLRR